MPHATVRANARTMPKVAPKPGAAPALAQGDANVMASATKKAPSSVSNQLLDVRDNLSAVGELVETACLALSGAHAIGPKEASAVHRLLAIVAERLEAEIAALAALDAIRQVA
jgi:hypothetical protein